jgi:hypothetical protein
MENKLVKVILHEEFNGHPAGATIRLSQVDAFNMHERHIADIVEEVLIVEPVIEKIVDELPQEEIKQMEVAEEPKEEIKETIDIVEPEVKDVEAPKVDKMVRKTIRKTTK